MTIFRKFVGLRGNVVLARYKPATKYKPNRWELKFKTDNGIEIVEYPRNYNFLLHEELQYLKEQLSKRKGIEIFIVDIDSFECY